MSILGEISSNDLGGGRGKPLPITKLRGTIESATPNVSTGNGTRLKLMVGQITTPEGAGEYINGNGSTYHFGNRKVFVDEWTDHPSETAARIGKERLYALLIATGLIPKPGKNEKVSDPFNSFEEMAEALNGKSFLFTPKHVTRKDKNNQVVYEDDGTTPKVDSQVGVFHAP